MRRVVAGWTTAVSLGAALVALVVAAALCAPPAHAQMLYGNYNLWNNRWTNHIWYWMVRPCQHVSTDCIMVAAQGNPSRDAADFQTDAHLADGRYTLVIDVPDGLRCMGANLPTHDTYVWDAVALTGTIDSAYETGCGGAEAGVNTYTFALERM